jgi:hypothetical protein
VRAFVASVLAQESPPPTVQPSISLVTTSAVIALSIVIITWPLVHHAITIAHEGSHALVISAFGARVESITIRLAGGGGTQPGRGLAEDGFGAFFTGLAGYIGPSVFGVLGAILIVEGRVRPMLWLSVVCLILVLIQTVNPGGLISVTLTGTILFFVARDGTENTQLWFAHIWVWFLLIGGFWHVVGLMDVRRGLREKGQPDLRSDAARLGVITMLPAALWVGFFWLASLATLLFGAAILLGLIVEPVDWPGARPAS